MGEGNWETVEAHCPMCKSVQRCVLEEVHCFSCRLRCKKCGHIWREFDDNI